MSLLRFGIPALVRRSSLLPLLHLSNGFSSSSSLQTPPCSIIGAVWCGEYNGKLAISNADGSGTRDLDKKVPLQLLYNLLYDLTVTIGASHGWIATLKVNDGILRLQDDLNPFASDTDPKRITLPPLVTLPRCQTRIVTNLSMSSSSPEDEDCVVAVKFLGPQLSLSRPAQSNSAWTNFRIENPCFYSSRVVFSKKDDMFRILGSGGHLIGSWDLCEHSKKPKLQSLRFQNLPELTKTKRELLDSCCTSEHLVESPAGETFLIKWYKKTAEIIKGVAKMKTEALMVFKLDDEGNAVYTEDIGDLSIFLSKSEPFCVPASSFPGMLPNDVNILDFDETVSVNVAGFDEMASVDLARPKIISKVGTFYTPYYIPPQNIDK